MTLTVGSVCTGTAALDAAVAAVLGDTRLAWVADPDPAATKLLAHHYPDVPNLGDLTTVDWDGVRDMPRGAPRQIERGQAMYDRYCQGQSLSEVGAEFGVSRQTVYTMFKRRGFNMRPRTAPSPFIEFDGERYTLDESNGYYRKTRADRAKLHRDMWRHHHGPIPDGWDVHHRDHDKTHNVIENLQCLPKDEHTRLHHLEAQEVMQAPAPAVDILTAGWP